MKHMVKILYATFTALLAIGGCKSEGEPVGSSPENTTYVIDGESLTLRDGLWTVEVAPGSATRTRVFLFAEPAYGDIDSDGDNDAVVILVKDPGGSGTFHYAAIAVNSDGMFTGTDAILLGDRIILKEFRIDDNRAKVDYAIRAPGESFAIEPSLAESIHLQYDPESLRLIQLAVELEGETDTDVLTLTTRPWKWIRTTYNNDTEVTPIDTAAFVLILGENGQFSATTDCNSINGDYEIDGHRITFECTVDTERSCDASQERAFTSMLEETRSFFFTGRGELILELRYDSGSVLLR